MTVMAFQVPLITVYQSSGSSSLNNWLVQCNDGEFQTVQDDLIKSYVLEIKSQNVAVCSIITPKDPKESLGIRLPYITFLIKNLGQDFTLEITIMDSENFRRRFRVSTYQTTTRVSMFMCSMPFRLPCGWNQVQFNLADITARTFNTTYVETVRIQVHANCRLRRVYFSDQLYEEDKLPNSYKLYRTQKVREKPARVLKKKVNDQKKSMATRNTTK